MKLPRPAGLGALNLSTRIVVAIVAMVLCASAAIGIVTYRALISDMYPAERERLVARSDARAERVVRVVDDSMATLLAIANTPSVSNYVASVMSGDSTAQVTWRAHIEAQFLAHLAANPEYFQIRVIGAGEGGPELIRVERSTTDGAVSVVPPENLQLKGDRPYFAEAMGTGAGEVYVSPIELNSERGEIEVPHVPVTRLATPLLTDQGQPFGILIINVNLGPILESIRDTRNPDINVYMVNSTGDYLVHPDRSREFGFDLGTPQRVQDQYPALARLPGNPEPFSLQFEDPSGTDMVVGTAPRYRNGEAWFTLFILARESAVLAPIYHTLRTTLLLTIGAVLAAALLAIPLGRSVSSPIARMVKAIDRVDRGGEADLSALSKSSPDMQVLTSAFSAHVESERLFNAAVQSSSDAILTKTLDGTITAWNAAAEKLYGYTRDEALGRPISMLVPQVRRDEFDRVQVRLRAGEAVEPYDTIRLNKAGQRLEVSVSVSPVRSAAGVLIGASEISRDLTEKNRMDALFRLAVEASPAAMIMTDGRGRIVLSNAEGNAMFGYGPGELDGLKVDALVPERFREAHAGHREGYMAEPRMRQMGADLELFGLRKDGSEFPVEIGLNPLHGSRDALILNVVVDITERKKAEEALAARTHELERSNAELQRFAVVASHDLQEPLRMVTSFCDLLKERHSEGLDEEALEFIEFAVDGAHRMRDLITDLLEYSRLQSKPVTFGPVSVERVVELARLNLAAAIAEKGVQIEVGPMPVVLGSEIQLGRLFQNLIGNAVKFGGDERPEVRVTAMRRGGDWLFKVADNGIGFDAKYTESIFGVFERLHTRDEYPGTGIGLAQCKRIVERHGGKIWATSTPGAGSTFSFTLKPADAGDTSGEGSPDGGEADRELKDPGYARSHG